jgi:hypothetical protein
MLLPFHAACDKPDSAVSRGKQETYSPNQPNNLPPSSERFKISFSARHAALLLILFFFC